MKVESLHRHPLKSAAIEDVDSLQVLSDGLEGDRRWMVIDANSRFVSQREFPKLATVRPRLDGDTLEMNLGGTIVEANVTSTRVQSMIWRDDVSLALAADRANNALSDYLGTSVRLARMDSRTRRSVNGEWGSGPVTLADGYPLLIALTSSLDALNAAIEEGGASKVTMTRFRPNVVIGNAPPWDDDGWAAIRVGDVELEITKPCVRCSITTVDQDRGTVVNDEPLATLRRLRMSGDRRVPGMLFGWNATVRRTGSIAVSDPVEVLARREPWPIRSAAP